MRPNHTPALPVEELDPVDGEAATPYEGIPLTGGTPVIPQVIEPEQCADDERDWRLINARLVSLLYDAGLDAEKWELENNIPTYISDVAEAFTELAFWVEMAVDEVVCFRHRLSDEWRLFVTVELDDGSLPDGFATVSRDGGVLIEQTQRDSATLYVSPSYDWEARLNEYRAIA